MRKSYHKTICLNFETEAYYAECLFDSEKFKHHLNRSYEIAPELFPANMSEGWCLHGYTEESKKQNWL